MKKNTFISIGLIGWMIISIPRNFHCDPTIRNGNIDTANKKNIYFKVAENTANWLASLAVEDPYGAIRWPRLERGSYYSIGLDTGATGIGRFFLELYEVNPDLSYLQYAEGAGRYISQHGYEGVQLDWLGGPGAAGSFFLDLYRTTGDMFYLQEAEKAGDWIIAKHYEENGGYYWILFPSLPDRIYTSWAHGAAGLGAFLAELCEATGNIKYLDAAKKAATWLFSYMWEPEPGLYCWPRLTTDDFANTTWCGGSVGIILFLIKLYESSADEIYLNYAIGATDWLVSQAHDGGEGTYKWSYGPQSYSFPFAYCHGTPSVVHVLYIMHEYTQNPVFLEYARGGAGWMMKEAEVIEEGLCRWPHIQGYRHETGLLCGTAAVGNSFLLYYAFDPDEKYLEYAEYAARWLISVAEYNQLNEMKWINYVDDTDYGQKEYETGWYSGASGVGLFFLKLSQVLPDSSIGKNGIQRR